MSPAPKKIRSKPIPRDNREAYTDDEVEFMTALDQYKRDSGHMFPTCSEVLTVLRKLGYSKQTAIPGRNSIGIVAVVICHDRNGEILIQKRGPGCADQQGCWDFVGGKVDLFELAKDAALREVREELGVTLAGTRLVYTRDFVQPAVGNPRHRAHWVSWVYTALFPRGAEEIKEPDKIEELRWVTLDKLPRPRHYAIDYHLDAAIRGKHLPISDELKRHWRQNFGRP